ncbi:hypothetical protein WDZ16_11700 [Pseudokineococcus marinus]|uniref:Uncharacterized protein n=1 Tax=Pseudokineococcus marinus TaxID=351215 RepID=A0A849BSI4_9ACTN|nr:hypothetical protein [Pseudokineococcus marinus]NNH24383.1 hypothetical protein [Pseudokineococcus marinus]
MAPLTTARSLVLRLAVVLQLSLRRLLAPRLEVLRAQPQRGASAIEWVLITAVVVVIVGVVAFVIRDLVVDRAEEIEGTINIPNG